MSGDPDGELERVGVIENVDGVEAEGLSDPGGGADPGIGLELRYRRGVGSDPAEARSSP
jgi:hypothetical protein